MSGVTIQTDARPLLSIVTGCYNEQDNVQPLYERIFAAVRPLEQRYRFELILIDNHSQDATVERISAICAQDARVKLIVNARNFGHVRSPFHALLQAQGVAVIGMASDLEDPPELIPRFIEEWEKGAAVVAGVYESASGTGLLGLARKAYYRIIAAVAEAQPIAAFTGFGLYDRRVVELLRKTGGPYPYVRGLVSEFGLPIKTIPFTKPKRQSGITKQNFLTLVDFSILGLTSMSRAPIRMATLLGAMLSFIGFLLALIYLVAKIIFWDRFPFGQAPLLIGIFLFGSVQIFIVGLIGEYIASLHQRAQNFPYVVELRRINFDSLSPPPDISAQG
ncbi:MAG: glycosyltransferase family 2 protein [Betaproteobacteria bacterium]|nr:glycosyltransferase family 2 protein [Betaproteobacteria bacterium]